MRPAFISLCLAILLTAMGCGAKGVSGGSNAGSQWRDYSVKDFEALHSIVDGDDNKGLILGALTVSRPARGLAPELAAFLGRWEGFDLSPPVKKDIKGVLVIREINPKGGKAVLWAGYNLQYPFFIKEINFDVVEGESPSIKWRADRGEGPSAMSTYHFEYQKESKSLKGRVELGGSVGGPFELTRNRNFYVYRDYARYFALMRFYPKEYEDSSLDRYGKGYLLYLPDSYDSQSEKKWPLILFLCGSGDRGSNIFLFAKNGPFQMIREKAPLPFIIVAPMLEQAPEFRSFPNAYLDGLMAEIGKLYRVDPSRLYLTGISMGGEASYRYAAHRPGTFAAVAPLAAFDARFNPGALDEGFSPIEAPLEKVKGLPILAIHGADDVVVPLGAASRTAEEFKEAGAKIEFRVLKAHDHDVWTDSYLDPEFYEWLLRHKKP
jgi:acetyl esterase/lipase